MLCNEPIIAAYSGQPNYESGYSRLDCFYDMKLYQSSKNREILETEHYYILLESNDVKVINKTSSIEGIAKAWVGVRKGSLPPDGYDLPQYCPFVCTIPMNAQMV